MNTKICQNCGWEYSVETQDTVGSDKCPHCKLNVFGSESNRKSLARKLWPILNFDTMIWPSIIGGIFVIEVIASIALGVLLIVLAAKEDSPLLFIFGIVLTILGPIAARLVNELLIVIFKIHNSLIEIRNVMRSKMSEPEASQVKGAESSQTNSPTQAC